MAQCPLARQGRFARLAPLVIASMALLITGCAGSGANSTPSARSSHVASASIAGDWISVQRGDTLGTIARRAGIPLLRLQRFNPGVDSRHLAVGQRLLVPSRQERAPSGGPYRYQVRPGDTYSAVARRFGTTTARIQSANPGVRATDLKVGQLIQVPLRASSASSSRATAASSAPSSSARLPDPGPVTSRARGWPWPLDDYRVVRRYGNDSRGRLQPMLLATDEGANAKAVADGEVSFADSMRQLGKVVIVHHADNLQSVYALCGDIVVSKGDQVTRGTPLCSVGKHSSTGRYDLLFDMRHGGKPIDPGTILR